MYFTAAPGRTKTRPRVAPNHLFFAFFVPPDQVSVVVSFPFPFPFVVLPCICPELLPSSAACHMYMLALSLIHI